MMTLKQAFSVAALQQSAKTQSQQCDGCPMQQLHRLCERIEGRKLGCACVAGKFAKIDGICRVEFVVENMQL